MWDSTYCFFAIVVIVIGVVFYGGITLGMHAEFPGRVSEIEQLRQDSKNLKVNSEDVIGQITEYNQAIRSMQTYNKLWWSTLIVPNGWDDIELIPIPGVE